MIKITPDKWKHFFVAIPMGAVLEIAGWFFFPHRPFTYTALAFLISFVICYGFELFSRITGWGHYEIMDIIAGLAGSIIGIGIVFPFLY